MAEFDYTAVSRDEYRTGRISAENEELAQAELMEKGMKVISVSRRQPLNIGALSKPLAQLESYMEESMSTSEKILFTGQLSSMIKAGLPLIEALSAFSEENSKKGSSRIIGKLIVQLEAGVKLSDAMAGFPRVFPPAYLAVVKAGENSGSLAESLNYLSGQLRRESELANSVKSALIYPTVVITAMLGVMIFISVSVVPKILVFAENSGQKLPFYTLALVGAVDILTNYWYLLILAIIGAAVGFAAFARSDYGSHKLGDLSLRLPVIGDLVSRYNQARFARMLGGFYLYGVNIIGSIDILATSLSNPLYRDACFRIKHRLTLGQSLADAIAQEQRLFPSIMIRLIKGAEKTGELGATLDKLDQFYEEELAIALRNVLALVEPVMIFILGFGVLGLALAVVVPIYQLTSTLK